MMEYRIWIKEEAIKSVVSVIKKLLTTEKLVIDAPLLEPAGNIRSTDKLAFSLPVNCPYLPHGCC
jgi:hypothetical protein